MKKHSIILFIFIVVLNTEGYSSSLRYKDTIPTSILSKTTKTFNLPNSQKENSIPKIKEKKISVNQWKYINKPGLLLTQTSFLNWSKGGNNTVAGIISFKGDYDYSKGQLFWKNGVLLRYGLSKENGTEHSQKTEDIIDLKSSFGYKTEVESKWYYSAEFNLTTQFAKGYAGNNRTTLISNFFAPARIRLGVGTVYTDLKDKFKLHLSPLTNQITIVLDQELANKGAFGVTPAIENNIGEIIKEGENIYSEFGSLIRFEYKTQLMENIDTSIKSSFYSDYLNNFGNIDTDIEINITMKVNQFINSRISSHLLYDDDAKTLESNGKQSGPKLQLKQILGLGVTYIF